MEGVKRTIKKFNSFAEAEAADDVYYLSLTPEERMEIFFKIIGHTDPKDGIVERCIRVYPAPERE